MDRISRLWCVEGLIISGIPSLLFAHYLNLLASLKHALQLAVMQFAAKCEVDGMRISTSNSDAMALNWERVNCLLRDRDKLLPQVEDCKHLGVSCTNKGNRSERLTD